MAALWNSLDAAARMLVGSGPVKQRLIEAYKAHLAPLHDKDVPEALRSRLALLREAMHASAAAGGMSAPEVSVRKMSDKDAAEHAVRILEMYAALCAGGEAEPGGAPRLRIVGGDDGEDEPPAFLSRA